MANPQTEDGFTRISNEIIEKLCRIKLSAYQTRIVFCIIRKTYGFNKKEDWISNSQFVLMTGLRPAHVSRSISELLMMQIVTKRGNLISLQKDWTLWTDLPNGVRRHDIVTKRGNSFTKRGNAVTKRGNSFTKRGVHKIQYTKDTYTKDTLQKKGASIKNLKEEDLIDISKKYNVPLAFVMSKFDDMQNWLEAKGKRYKNYKAALSNWVKKDAIAIINKERQAVNKFKVTQV